MGNPLKNVVLHSLRAAGLFSVSTRVRRSGSLVILCYHGISLNDEHEWAGGLYITPEFFRKRLEFLRSWRANVLPLDEGLTRLRAGSLPPRSVAITFDDGFYDFYKFAYPALREFGFPCTVYLTTWYMQYRLPIFNLITKYILWKGARPEFRSVEARDQAVARYMEKLAAEDLSPDGADALARGIAESAGLDYEGMRRARMFQIMSPDEVRDLAASGFDIQLHTHRHRTPADRNLFIREIEDNRKRIREVTGTDPRHFCYPSGVTSPQFLPWLKECGVQSATTCVRGAVTTSENPLLLPRYLDGTGSSELDFESWLSGIR